MNARIRLTTVPPLSRRGESLGTENAFVVLAEVNALARSGKDIVSFCIGQPDFPTPRNIQDAAIAAIRGGKHGYTPSAGIDELRAAAARDLGARRGLDIRAGRRRRRRGRQAVHRLHDRVGHRLRRRRRSDLPGAGISDLRVADHRQRRRAGADLPARSARLRVRSGRARSEDHAEDAAADPQLAAESRPAACSRHADLDAIAEILRAHPQIWVFADEIYSRLIYDGEFDSLATRAGMLERTIICDGASKTWAMTGWRIGYVANRALAPVFTRWITNTESCASQISQWAGGRGDQRPAGRRVADMRARFLERRDLIVRLLNDVPGITCKTSGRRVLRVAQRHARRASASGCADSEAFRKRLLHEAGIAVLADIHFGRRVCRLCCSRCRSAHPARPGRGTAGDRRVATAAPTLTARLSPARRRLRRDDERAAGSRLRRPAGKVLPRRGV